ncbi:MAG: PAS domain-containing protein, partial [Chloroflexota bacterium]|nr:PAS domain-containing protein [Chloroflexota bacterium]
MTQDEMPTYAELSDQVRLLRDRVAHFEAAASASSTGALGGRDLFQLVFDHLPQSICWKDRDSRYLGCNRSFARTVGLQAPSEILGKTDYDLPSAEYADHYRADDRQVMESGAAKINFEEPQPQLDGSLAWIQTSKIPLFDTDGAVIGVLVAFEDITERKQAEEARASAQAEYIQMQAILLEELSTPLIPITQNVVVMPLIGSIDSRRAQQVLNTLLQGITERHARVAILDITGVPLVDTQVAGALIRAAQAAQLLGAQVVLTGIRPEVAQTLVG